MSSLSPISIKEHRLPLFACSEGSGEVIHWTLKTTDYQTLCSCKLLYWQKVKVHDKKELIENKLLNLCFYEVIDNVMPIISLISYFHSAKFFFFSFKILFHLETCHIIK